MKTIVALFLACFATALFGQGPPIQRNPFTTNSTPAAQSVVTNIALAVAGTNRIQILSPAAGNNGYTDGDTIAPVAPFTMGISYYGNRIPFVKFSGSTNVGDWRHGVIFPAGAAQFGSPDSMDTNVTALTPIWYVNGSSNSGWKASGDAFPVSANMSTNSGSSGSGWSIATISSSNGQIPSVIGTVDASFLLTKTNASPVIIPGWAQMVFNIPTGGGLITNHIRGLAITSPNMSPGGFTAGNYSLGMFDTINKVFRVPYWVSGVFQPQDNPAAWRDTLKVDPVNGRVGVGILPDAFTPSATFQAASPQVELVLGYNGSSLANLDVDEFHARDKTGPVNDLLSWSVANGRSGRFVGSAWTNNAHLVVNSNLTVLGREFVSAGSSASNAAVGGVMFMDFAQHTNHSTVGAWTNLGNFTIPAHTLTNNGDMVEMIASGVNLIGTNGLQIGYGSQTNILDIGLASTNGQSVTWQAVMRVTRTGNTSQRIHAQWSCSPGGGAPFTSTNSLIRGISETNGIANILKLSGEAIRAGGITNDEFIVRYYPASR